ncbi:hypothetical protein ACWGHU_09975 [Streptomyces xanthophaeus]
MRKTTPAAAALLALCLAGCGTSGGEAPESWASPTKGIALLSSDISATVSVKTCEATVHSSGTLFVTMRYTVQPHQDDGKTHSFRTAVRGIAGGEMKAGTAIASSQAPAKLMAEFSMVPIPGYPAPKAECTVDAK